MASRPKNSGFGKIGMKNAAICGALFAVAVSVSKCSSGDETTLRVYARLTPPELFVRYIGYILGGAVVGVFVAGVWNRFFAK